MAKKAAGKVIGARADQVMTRIPPGMRAALANRAAETGRSVNTTIVEAIEQYLARADRTTTLLDFLETHRSSIENLAGLQAYIDELEGRIKDLERADRDPNPDR